MVSDAISCPLPLEYNHDTLQLCRPGHDYVLCTRMTTLTFMFLSYLPLMVKATMPSILNTIRNIVMRLHSSVEEIMTVCRV